MRIIAGTYKGRRIQLVPDKGTRPTADRVREAWASTIISLIPGGSLEGIRVLDPFAGSGALGLELLSRGARTCLFIDKSKSAMAVLRANIASLKLLESQAKACCADSLVPRLPSCLHYQDAFELLVLDPPYNVPRETVGEFLVTLGGAKLITGQTLISYEHDASDHKTLSYLTIIDGEKPVSLELVSRKKYGTICVDYYLSSTVLGLRRAGKPSDSRE